MIKKFYEGIKTFSKNGDYPKKEERGGDGRPKKKWGRWITKKWVGGVFLAHSLIYGPPLFNDYLETLNFR